MVTPYEQLDRRFDELRRLTDAAARPSRGWVHAIREALGMTTGQLAKRLRVQQPRVIELERGEANGKITMQTLERAAEALGCRLVYVLIPTERLADTLESRTRLMAERYLSAVEHSMRLEGQEVSNKAQRKESLRKLMGELLRRPARLWDEL